MLGLQKQILVLTPGSIRFPQEIPFWRPILTGLKKLSPNSRFLMGIIKRKLHLINIEPPWKLHTD